MESLRKIDGRQREKYEEQANCTEKAIKFLSHVLDQNFFLVTSHEENQWLIESRLHNMICLKCGKQSLEILLNTSCAGWLHKIDKVKAKTMFGTSFMIKLRWHSYKLHAKINVPSSSFSMEPSTRCIVLQA